jgi:hypothetical protein
VPRSAKGKRLTGTVAVTYKGATNDEDVHSARPLGPNGGGERSRGQEAIAISHSMP